MLRITTITGETNNAVKTTKSLHVCEFRFVLYEYNRDGVVYTVENLDDYKELVAVNDDSIDYCTCDNPKICKEKYEKYGLKPNSFSIECNFMQEKGYCNPIDDARKSYVCNFVHDARLTKPCPKYIVSPKNCRDRERLFCSQGIHINVDLCKAKEKTVVKPAASPKPAPLKIEQTPNPPANCWTKNIVTKEETILAKQDPKLDKDAFANAEEAAKFLGIDTSDKKMGVKMARLHVSNLEKVMLGKDRNSNEFKTSLELVHTIIDDNADVLSSMLDALILGKSEQYVNRAKLAVTALEKNN